MDVETKNNQPSSNKRPRTDNNNNNNVDPTETKRAKREMPTLEELNYLDDSAKEGMLYSAISKKDLEMVMFLVENAQVNFDTVSSKKYPIENELLGSGNEFIFPVMASILANSYDITEYFLTKKFQTVFSYPEDNLVLNAILLACIVGNPKTVQLVIDYDQKALLPKPDFPLHISVAAQCNNYHVIEVLQKNGVEVNSICPKSNSTALHMAAQSGACDAVKTLIKLGANIHALDKDNDTPLSLAVKHEKYEVVKELLNNGADLFISSTDVNTNAVQQVLQHPFFDVRSQSRLLQLLALENNFGKNRIKEAAAQGNFDITVIPQDLMEDLEQSRSKILKDKATYHLLGKLLTSQETKVEATGILEEMINADLGSQQSSEEQEKILKQNQEYITGMQIFSNVPDEPKRIILSFLSPNYLPTNTPLESKKAVEIADVVFSNRYAKK